MMLPDVVLVDVMPDGRAIVVIVDPSEPDMCAWGPMLPDGTLDVWGDTVPRSWFTVGTIDLVADVLYTEARS